jgi:hypothetical protein
MKTKIMVCAIVLLLSVLSGSASGGSEGTSNTFYGTGAGAGTTGDDDFDTFIGAGAGYSNIGGSFNTFLGYYAGYASTTSGFNTFIGTFAGTSNTTGDYNTFLGNRTGMYNSGGVNNTFLGNDAGYSNTTGSFNTFLGYYAGTYNTTGSFNTFLGNGAGGGNTTGSESVFLGYRAGYFETGSNKLYIDNSDTSTPLIYGEFDNDILRINGRLGVLKSPGASYQLDVNGAVNATSFVGDGSGLTNLNEVDPQVGTLTSGRWCTTNGSTISCTQTAPVLVEVDPKIGSLTADRWCTTNGSTVSCTQTAPVLTEVDPKVGSLTTGRWCTTNGSTVSCTQTAPVLTESDPEVGSNSTNYVSKWNGSALVSGSLYDDGMDVTVLANLNVVAPDNGLIYLTNVITDNTPKVSRMVVNHYSNAQLPVYLFGAASTATNNFVAFGGGNTIGNAATQLDLFTAENPTTPVGSPRITIKGNGYIGIGTQTPSYPLQMVGGAYSNGSSWIDASSREYKENIEVLSTEEALEAIKELNPVKYAYKEDTSEKRVGFIAEDVPELLSTKDRKGLSPMDIVAVLTKVVQDQQKSIQEQQKTAQEQKNTISLLKEELNELKGKAR